MLPLERSQSNPVVPGSFPRTFRVWERSSAGSCVTGTFVTGCGGEQRDELASLNQDFGRNFPMCPHPFKLLFCRFLLVGSATDLVNLHRRNLPVTAVVFDGEEHTELEQLLKRWSGRLPDPSAIVLSVPQKHRLRHAFDRTPFLAWREREVLLEVLDN